ncbi:hypothetical protein Tco_1302638 [Tanacetum coccineum]
MNDDFSPVAKNEVTKVLEVVPFEEQIDDLKRKFAKNNEAKMVHYNVLPKKEYERIFMCKMAKDIQQLLLITNQGNIQVKDNKIDLLVQQYEQFTILEEESIDSGFSRFNTIITSLKALDKGKKERVKSIALKAKKESSDDEILTSESDNEEYAMAAKVIVNALDAMIRIISLANDQSHHAPKNKKHFMGVLGAIAKMKPRTKPTKKLVSWLNR